MQADRFTIKAQEAVAAAQRLAASQGNSELSPAHLLVALIGEDEGFAAQLLVKVGADMASVRGRALAAVEALPSVSGDEPAEVRPSKSLVDTIKRAEREAAAGGDEYISTDHLLLALADQASGVSELLPARDAIAAAVSEVRPDRVSSPNPEETAQALEKFGRDLTAAAESGKLDPVIGRDDEIRRVIQVLSRRTKNNPVLIGDTSVGAGASEGAVDAANLLKPMLARGELRAVGATTLDEYRKHIEPDAALERRFAPVFVDEPDVPDTIAILRGLKDRYEQHHGVRIADAALVAAATL